MAMSLKRRYQFVQYCSQAFTEKIVTRLPERLQQLRILLFFRLFSSFCMPAADLQIAD